MEFNNSENVPIMSGELIVQLSIAKVTLGKNESLRLKVMVWLGICFKGISTLWKMRSIHQKDASSYPQVWRTDGGFLTGLCVLSVCLVSSTRKH